MVKTFLGHGEFRVCLQTQVSAFWIDLEQSFWIAESQSGDNPFQFNLDPDARILGEIINFQLVY